MNCPYCKSKTKIIETTERRLTHLHVRQCYVCGHRYRTTERNKRPPKRPNWLAQNLGRWTR